MPGKVLGHIGVCAGGLLLILGLPFLATKSGRQLLCGSSDAVSSASVILEEPSGEYVIFINRSLHTKEHAGEWERFFGGEDILYIFEDISCSVAKSDAAALEMAQSFQSRLPEHQMRIVTEDPTLLFSRAEQGKFDVLILSKEYEDAYAVSVPKEDAVRLVTEGGEA